MINHGDVFNLMFRIRGGLARDMYGMQHEGLFSRAQAGTKLLVEDYHETVAAALNYICDNDSLDEEVCMVMWMGM
jgi:TAG lipase / steryl ester hydrolase / phospholipase A2 / LPA acyltransferase